MNLNLEQVGGALLVISQFTLYADTSSRPSTSPPMVTEAEVTRVTTARMESRPLLVIL